VLAECAVREGREMPLVLAGSMGESSIARKRAWEIGAGSALLILLGLAGFGFFYYQQLNAALADAIDHNDAPAAFGLMRRGANLRTVGHQSGRTALYLMVGDGETSTSSPSGFTWMLDHGADVNELPAPAAFRPTALVGAASDGASRCVHLLLEHGADPNLHAPGYESALMAAVEALPDEVRTRDHARRLETQTAIVRELLEHGADPTARVAATGNDTPLVTAARHGCIPILKLLLKQGADPRLRDFKGRTAYDHAIATHHPDAARLLASAPPRREARATSRRGSGNEPSRTTHP
jgi:hypothetical protein